MRYVNLDYIYQLALLDIFAETGKNKSYSLTSCEWTKKQLTDINFIYDFLISKGS